MVKLGIEPAMPKLYARLVFGRTYGGNSYWSKRRCHSVTLLSPKKYRVSVGVYIQRKEHVVIVGMYL